MVRFLKNHPTSHNSSAEAIITVKSRLLMPPIGKGEIVALHPNTKNILNRLLPITFPMAIPGFFFNAAVTEVASSGNEVPPATKVNPITDSLTPSDPGNTACSFNKELPAKDETCQSAHYKKNRFPYRHLFNLLFFSHFFASVSCNGKCISQENKKESEQNKSVNPPDYIFIALIEHHIIGTKEKYQRRKNHQRYFFAHGSLTNFDG